MRWNPSAMTSGRSRVRVTADKKYWRKPLAVMDLAQIVANVDTFRAEWLEAAGAQDVFSLFCHRRCLLELAGEFLCLVGLKDQAQVVDRCRIVVFFGLVEPDRFSHHHHGNHRSGAVRGPLQIGGRHRELSGLGSSGVERSATCRRNGPNPNLPQFVTVSPTGPFVTEADVWGHVARNTCSGAVDNRRPVRIKSHRSPSCNGVFRLVTALSFNEWSGRLATWPQTAAPSRRAYY